jgi:DNA-binding NtrC family response regulator
MRWGHEERRVREGRTLPLLGPAVVLYLAVELLSASRTLDAAAIVLATMAMLASLLPMVLSRAEETEGARRLSFIATAVAVGLVGIAQPDVLSLPLELAVAIAWPPVGSFVVDLALDTPDRPPGLARARALKTASHVIAGAMVVLGIVLALPPIELGGGTILMPASLAPIAPTMVVLMLGVAFGVRVARRQLGSTPEALASNGWALLGTAFAVVASVAGLAAIASGAYDPGDSVVRGLACGAAVAVVLGHYAMLDSKRPIHAARAARRVVAAALAIGALAAGIALFAHRLPGDAIALGVLAAAFLASGAVAYRAASWAVDRVVAPDGGRLLRAIEEIESAIVGARTLEELGAAVLIPLRVAARTHEARPLIQTLSPARQVVVDGAGLPKAEAREMSAAIVGRLTERPGDVVVLAPLVSLVVRRPHLRPLVEALEQLEALCVVPVAAAGDLEGALVVPRGRRRAPVTLEEIAALERLASRLVGPLAMQQAEARAQERAGKAIVAGERLEEKIDALEDEIERLAREAKILKAGKAADRLAAPAIAYSASMRALAARVSEVGPALAPVQIVAEGGIVVDSIGHLVHAASPMREGPIVIADCASVRPERTAAALFGDEGADGSHPGWLHLAAGGTLVLVDAPALALEVQASLADAIATRSARAAGGGSAYPLEARVLAHTRIDLAGLVRVGAFDADLARRLEPLKIEVPPLRDRRDDLPSLVLVALDRACRAIGCGILGIDDAAMARLHEYDWPGNQRELQAVIDRAVLAAKPPRVQEKDLPALPEVADIEKVDPLDGTWTEIELRILRAALDRASGNKSEAARLLGLKRTTFLDKLRRAGFEVRDSLTPSSPPTPPAAPAPEREQIGTDRP